MKFPRWAYWLCFVLVSAFAWNVAGGLVAALLWTVLYLPVAVLRARDAGLSKWYGLRVLIPFVGLWETVHLGIAPTGRYSQPAVESADLNGLSQGVGAERPRPGDSQPATSEPIWLSRHKWLVVSVVALLVLASAAGAVMLKQRSSSSTIARCDSYLRQQLVSANHAITSNAMIDNVQREFTGCSRPIWNPQVVSFNRDHLGNIDLTFADSASDNTVTQPAAGVLRWVYVSSEQRWYSSALTDPSVLAPPTKE